MIEALPVPILASLILFAVFPMWQTSLVVLGAFAFSGVNRWLTARRTDELEKIRDDIKSVKAQLEGIQLQRTLHR